MSKTPPSNVKANTTFNGNSNKSNVKSQLKSLNSTKKLTITIISEFNWCTINLSEILLKFCLNLPKNFTLAQLTQKCLTTIENIYYLKNVKLSRFRDSNGYDIVSDYKTINQENTFFVAILDAEDNKQTQLDRFKESLTHNNGNINIHKSFQVLDLPDQMNLPSFTSLTPIPSIKSSELFQQPQTPPTASPAVNEKKKAIISKAKVRKPKVVSIPPNPNKKSKLKNKMKLQVNLGNSGQNSDAGGDLSKANSSAQVNKVQKK